MRFAPALTLAAVLAVAFAGTAEAQTSSKKRTQVTISKRSYLDAGTMVKPGSKSYTDYALPLNYNFPNYQGSAVGPGPITGIRSPLPGPFDLPGY
ncbi:hypothetical protein [Xanthobacter tagetidis]|jgi:hypothetical protein|uniref:Uncharacterized protein n=1 Tax=Xanthobacter tagetidis TaxID=60216 RepID=A0A3L7AKD6_9HYPH|nr:hypothetical protein [Xanthobacter tagetidis]MBB6306885.1 hypothetical protein [Xanthobacter tagetidis]RLP80048.1 hypothetical protein D9R14_06735 [Xanthobacter tagetidis]